MLGYMLPIDENVDMALALVLHMYMLRMRFSHLASSIIYRSFDNEFVLTPKERMRQQTLVSGNQII